MKKITLLLFALLLQSFVATAQHYPTGNLTIYSEDGSPFYLILNGQRYNDKPQTNVRLEMLPDPYYSCKIIFSNNRIPTISKNIQLSDVDDIMQDVTYRIKKDKKGRRSLKFYSQRPAAQNMVRPNNCAVYHYGQPNDMYIGPDGTVYHEEVTTTTTYNDGFGMNVNMGGVGMSVNVPGDNVTTTTTTTTTTTSGGYQQGGNYNNGGYNNGGNYNNGNGYNNNGGYNNGNGNGYNNGGNYNNGNGNGNGYNNNGGGYNNGNNNNSGCRNAMSNADFEAAVSIIKGSSFDDTREGTAKQILSNNCMSTDQIISLVKLLTFEENKLSLAKYAYNYCVDRKSYFKVANTFTFDASKQEMNEFLQGQR